MNKTFLFVIFAVLFVTIKSEFANCKDDNWHPNEASEDYCRILTTGTDKTHCCFMDLDGNKKCGEISDDEYENIKNYKKYLKNNYKKVKIKCSGEFTRLSLIHLISLVFLLAVLF